jgi:hypothetical protein
MTSPTKKTTLEEIMNAPVIPMVQDLAGCGIDSAPLGYQMEERHIETSKNRN